MATTLLPDDPQIRTRFFQLYRDFFNRAERRRRWNLETDIPWEQVNRSMTPAIADIVESFCAVELYLPDYIGKALPMIRSNRGWFSFHANWGYEESKHSLALGDWLLKSGLRSDEQMQDLESQLLKVEWTPPHDDPVGMLTYAMVQELATWLHYRNLKVHVDAVGDPALSRILAFIAVDERAHHAFYRTVVQFFLEVDRRETLEQFRRVILGFQMPAVHMLAETNRRVAQIKALNIFNEDMFLHDVYQPILNDLGIEQKELRRSSLAVKAR